MRHCFLTNFSEGVDDGDGGVSVELSDQQYGSLMRGLTAIAHGYVLNSNGNLQRISRTRSVQIAREVCNDLKWNWQNKEVAKFAALFKTIMGEP